MKLLTDFKRYDIFDRLRMAESALGEWLSYEEVCQEQVLWESYFEILQRNLDAANKKIEHLEEYNRSLREELTTYKVRENSRKKHAATRYEELRQAEEEAEKERESY